MHAAGEESLDGVDGYVPFSLVLSVATSALTAPLSTVLTTSSRPSSTAGAQPSQVQEVASGSAAVGDALAVAGALEPLARHCLASDHPWGVRLEALRSVKALLACAAEYGERGQGVQAAAGELLERIVLSADDRLSQVMSGPIQSVHSPPVHPSLCAVAVLNIELQYLLLVFTVFKVLEGPNCKGNELKTSNCKRHNKPRKIIVQHRDICQCNS